MAALVALLQQRARALLPGEGDYALHRRQRDLVGQLLDHLHAARAARDLLVTAEELRLGRSVVDSLTGQAGTEDMLDRLFSGFCIGK